MIATNLGAISTSVAWFLVAANVLGLFGLGLAIWAITRDENPRVQQFKRALVVAVLLAGAVARAADIQDPCALLERGSFYWYYMGCFW